MRARATMPLRLEQTPSPGLFAGISAAVPDPQGRLNQRRNIYGTSVAAALASRYSHQLMEAVLSSPSFEETDHRFWALYAKALLVHHSRIDENAYARLEAILRDGQSSAALKRDIAKFLAFGTIPTGFEPGCDNYQATMLAHGQIRRDEAHSFSVPVPQVLGGNIGYRALLVTVAWFTPVNSGHQLYRMAKLNVRLPRVAGMDGTNTTQPDDKSRGKGTIFHARFDGERGPQIGEGVTCEVVVECLAQAGVLDVPIPYAIAVSFEAGVNSGIDVYQAVRTRLAVQVRGAS